MRLILRVSLVFFVWVFNIASQAEAVWPDLCYEDNQFMFFLDKMDWVSARDDCIVRGGRLALINDSETHRAIKLHIRSNAELLRTVGGGYWFGLNDRDNEGTYVFEGSDGVELTYDGWCSERVGRRTVNQPNNNTSKNPDGQDCAQLWKNSKKKPKFDFDDAYCDNKKGYVCEIEDSEDCGGGGVPNKG